MENHDTLEKNLAALREDVAKLAGQVEELLRELRSGIHPVVQLLAQRGLSILSHGDVTQLIFPPDLPEVKRARFFDLMRRYSFRLFLRDLIQSPRGKDVRGLTRYCSLKTAVSYMDELREMRIVGDTADGGYALARAPIPSFGATLEWYVSQVLQREFLSPALFNVKLKSTRFGGDYDVVAVLAHHLVYVEVKSSPPRGVEPANVRSFVKRLRDLQPSVAVFLVDTELRMKDKMVPLFMEALAGTGVNGHPLRAERLVDEIFHIEHLLYLTNSRKGIYSNLRRCFRDYFRHAGTVPLSIGEILG